MSERQVSVYVRLFWILVYNKCQRVVGEKVHFTLSWCCGDVYHWLMIIEKSRVLVLCGAPTLAVAGWIIGHRLYCYREQRKRFIHLSAGPLRPDAFSQTLSNGFCKSKKNMPTKDDWSTASLHRCERRQIWGTVSSPFRKPDC